MTEALLTTAAHDLINPWTEVITRDSGKWEATDPLDPLLTTLDGLVASNGGAGMKGALSHARNLVNMQAFKLREEIRQQADAWSPATGVRVGIKLPLRASIQHVITRAELLYGSAQLTEAMYTTILDSCEQWKNAIHELIDPSRVKEISAPCPRCEVAFVLTEVDGEDVREPSLTIRYRTGDREQPQARCGYCGARWTGDQELLQLAGIIGANTDYDTLKAMGLGE